MQSFQTFLAPAKINLFLHIIGQRADGYHLLQSAFQLLDLHDAIHIKVTQNKMIERVNEVKGVAQADDICIKAAKLLQEHALKQDEKFSFGAQIKVDKHIPMGGGLGGGSSDAATALIALNHLWGLHLTRHTLMGLALSLGADVPFFIFGKNAWVEGIGEVLNEIKLLDRNYVIINPNINVSTQKIFNNKRLTKDTIPKTMSDFSGATSKNQPTSNVKVDFINQLEKIVCDEYSAVSEALNWLRQFGDARMSGSGASIFVEVENEKAALQVMGEKPTHLSGFIAKGLNQHPLYDLCF